MNWLRGIVAFALTTPAFAGDWYVDAVNGNDANSGATAASAWRTITHAVANTPQSGLQVVHVGPGVYDSALGEVFPIIMRPDLQVVGDTGPALTTVAGTGSGTLFQAESLVQSQGWYVPPTTQIRGLTLRNATSAINLWANWNAVSPTLADLVIESMSDSGVWISAGQYPCCGASQAKFERVQIRGCGRGVLLSGQNVTPSFSDCDFSGNLGSGMHITVGGFANVSMERCRIDGNGGDGMLLDAINNGAITTTLSDCSISGNVGAAWPAGTDSGLQVVHHGSFTRCTIAGNSIGITGLHNGSNGGQFDELVLTECIVYGNGDDIDFSVFNGGPQPNVSGSLIGDGDYSGTNGNFAADPLFVNAAGGDWRLRFNSPCIDLAPASTTLDLRGNARSVDGDLDTLKLADIGAFEHLPLELVGTAQLGTLVQWELWGPQGAPTTLYWSRAAIAGSPTSTPFGQLDLSPSAMRVYRMTTAGAVTPTVLQRTIPFNTFIVGQTFAFQSLVDSTTAPNGKAYSNPVQFTVTP